MPSAPEVSADSSNSTLGSLKIDSDTIRRNFLNFFEQHDHQYVHSSPVVLGDDPTLLFVNAGMNQFKAIFTGKADPNSTLGKLRRAHNSQKCIRAGGKHNDLDDVGKDLYHHTFFEMLGTWSFGDYFKEEAINLAMRFLTYVLFLEMGNLYATYFEGDPKLGLPADTETRDLWCQQIPRDHVVPGSFKDNFWEMGETGPCGPCTEIHYDRLESQGKLGHLVNTGDPNLIEIWNIVFIQYYREADGSLTPLPCKHVDTGMGLERLVSVVQGKLSNYDTDIFTPIFASIHKLSRFNRPYSGKVGADDVDKVDQAYRVIADHCRTLIIAIADGVTPSNSGRGYVIRRILRRAVRYAFEKLNAHRGFMAALVKTVAPILACTFPEINGRIEMVVSIVAMEETQFAATLKKGRKYFEKVLNEHKTTSSIDSKSESKFTLPGESVWKLYDTYGFPDGQYTNIICEERGIEVDVDGFDAAKQTALNLSRQGKSLNSSSVSSSSTSSNENVSIFEYKDKFAMFVETLRKCNVEPTNDEFKYTCGCYYEGDGNHRYRFTSLKANIVMLFDDKELRHIVGEGSHCIVVLDKTIFYSESGGQVSDVGFMDSEHGAYCEIQNAYSLDGYVFHLVEILEGSLANGHSVTCMLDSEVRADTMSNHTATHILNYALHERLGPTATQKGSYVCRDRLRFDVSIQKPITIDDYKAIEETCRKYIEYDIPLNTSVLPFADALKIPRIRTLPDEKYPNQVRVVSIGDLDLGRNADCETHDQVEPEGANVDTEVADVLPFKAMSIELCGGTHVHRTSHLEHFCIVESEPLGKGIRRLTAVTRQAAECAISSGIKLHELIESARDELDNVCDEDSALKVGGTFLELSSFIDAWSIPYVKRDELKKIMTSFRSILTGKIKAVTAHRSLKAFTYVHSMVNGVPFNGEDSSSGSSQLILTGSAKKFKALVALVHLGVDRKALNDLMNSLKISFPQLSMMLFSRSERVFDELSIRTICQASVPRDDQCSGDLKAHQWVEVIAGPLNGKHGGTAKAAQCRSSEYMEMNSIMNIAASTAEAMIGCNQEAVLLIDQSNDQSKERNDVLLIDQLRLAD